MICSILIAGAAAMLAGCAAGDSKPESAGSTASGPGKGKGYSHDPFPSTYHAYPGAPTLVTNVTIFDGEGDESTMARRSSATARSSRWGRR